MKLTYWRFRHLPNLILLHYADLIHDLDGEMRRLADSLEIAIDEAQWPMLVAAASFNGMKDKAQETAPDADLGEWSNSADFFHSARMGAWKTELSTENKSLYETINSQRLDPDMKVWAEQGRGHDGGNL